MAKPNINYIPAHPSNYSSGRGNQTIDTLIMHHMAYEGSAGAVFANSARNASSTYGVADGGILEQYVDESDTPWTSSNPAYDSRAITIEVSGDWRFGYNDAAVFNKTVELVKWIRTQHPEIKNVRYFRHREIPGSSTVCNGDFNMDMLWDMSEPSNVVAVRQPEISSVVIFDEPKYYELKRNTNLWDYAYGATATTPAIKYYLKGHVFRAVGYATVKNINGVMSTFYFTKYADDNDFTWGFNQVDVKAHVPVVPDDEPITPSHSCVNGNYDLGADIEVIQEEQEEQDDRLDDIEERLSIIERFMEWIRSFFS